MKTNLSKFLRPKLIIISALLMFLAFQSYNAMVEWKKPSEGSTGFWLGCILALIVLLGPLFYVHLSGKKLKNARALFIEPPLWLAAPLMLAAMGMSFFVFLILIGTITVIDPRTNDTLTNVDSFVGSIVMAFGMVTSFFAPNILYITFTKLRYKKVIEYGTPEWNEARKQKKNRR